MNWASTGLLIALLALQIPSGEGAITGIVVKTGGATEQPLRNARLELSGGARAALVTRTDANGRFSFSNLAPGEYRVAVTSDGFVRQQSPKKIVLGRGQQAASIRFALDPAPTAVGWVLDTNGEPIGNVMIEALRRSYDVRGNPRLARAATALTDDRGEYRIFWLDPGDYFFYAATVPDDAQVQPVSAVAPTYFPGVSTAADARSLRLDIGREVRVDFRLRRADLWPVKGQTMNEATGRSIAALVTLTPPAGDPDLSRYRANSSATGPYAGEFAMSNVPPGTYIVTAKSGSGDQEIAVFERIELRPLLSVPEDGYRVSLSLGPPVSINGRLYVESGEPSDLRAASAALISVDPDMPSSRSVLVRPDGQFTLNGAIPGNYVLDISNLPDDFYLRAARFGTDDILESSLVLKARDPAKPLQILLGTDGGRLGVNTEPGAQLVLVPDARRRSRREQYRVAVAGEDGQAMFRGIPPGSYKLFAWENLEPNAYLNADYLRSYEAQNLGIPVIIAPGDNPQVSARLIPK